MRTPLLAIALCLAAAPALAQSPQDFERQVARGVADLARSRLKQLGSGEWLRERVEFDHLAQGIERPDAAGRSSVGVLIARMSVRRSFKVPEAVARQESLPMELTGRRYEVQLRFEPDVAHGQWVFQGGRYWILDGQGQRQLELTMFPDLLRDAPLDAPHELAWAVMSP